MDYPIIWAIGRIEESVCPCCGQFLSRVETFKVMLTGRREHKNKPWQYQLLYCDNCNLPFITPRLSSYNKSTNTSYYVPEFVCNSPTLTPDRVRKQMNDFKRKMMGTAQPIQDSFQSSQTAQIPSSITTGLSNELAKRIRLPIVTPPHFVRGVYSTTIKICSIIQECETCHLELVDSSTYIPTNNKGTRCVKVSGKRCPKCGILYASKKIRRDIVTALTDNPHATAYSLIGYSSSPVTISKTVGGEQKKKKKQPSVAKNGGYSQIESKHQDKLNKPTTSLQVQIPHKGGRTIIISRQDKSYHRPSIFYSI